MQWFSDWWNDIELWLTQQSFWLQFALVIVVVGPVCAGLAWLIDRIVDRTSARFGPARRRAGRVLAADVPPAAEAPLDAQAEPATRRTGTAS